MSFPFWISFNLGQILFYVQLGAYFFHLTVSHQETIKLIKAVVFVNPFDEVDAVVSWPSGDQHLNSLKNLYEKEPSRSGE